MSTPKTTTTTTAPAAAAPAAAAPASATAVEKKPTVSPTPSVSEDGLIKVSLVITRRMGKN
jgi:hypothetical protein